MSSPESSLPEAWVRRIWDTMRATYGAAFDRQWECPAGVSPETHVANLMAAWGRGLAQLQQNPRAIAYGLDHLPTDHPPNLLQFKALCNGRPERAPLALDAPKADPGRVQQVIDGLGDTLRGAKDPLAWARAMHDADKRNGQWNGKPITLSQRACYRLALGLDRSLEAAR